MAIAILGIRIANVDTLQSCCEETKMYAYFLYSYIHVSTILIIQNYCLFILLHVLKCGYQISHSCVVHAALSIAMKQLFNVPLSLLLPC